MKQLLILSILIFSLKSYAQTGTIRVKKPVSQCTFTLLVDLTLAGDTLRLNKFYIKGVKKKRDAEDFRKKINYSRGKQIILTKESIEQDMLLVCDTKRYKLISVVIEKESEKSTFPLILGFILEEK